MRHTLTGDNYTIIILTLKITPQTVLFNDEDFHSVEILETVVRQSVVLVYSEMREFKIFKDF
jgi:hypothetical protein